MIKVTSNKGNIEIEINGDLDDVRAEFSQMCIELADKIGKEIEKDGVPEGLGAQHLLASLVTLFVSDKADMKNPVSLIANRKKIAEFCKKTEDYISDAINDFSSNIIVELNVDTLVDFLGNLFGADVKVEVRKPAEPAQEEAEKGCSDNEQSV